MNGLTVGDLTIDVTERVGALELRWLGMSNSQNPGTALKPFFALALAEATAKKLALELHFEQLKQFNSSTIAALLAFIDQAKKGRLKVHVFYDGSQRWQAHNFEPIAAMGASEGLLTLHKLGARPPEKVGES